MPHYCPVAGGKSGIIGMLGYKAPSAVEINAFNRAFALWCATSARPFAMRDDPGFRLTMSTVKPHGAKYVKSGLSRATTNKMLQEEAELLEEKIQDELQKCRKFAAPEGGPFCFVQLDLTTDQASHFCLSEFFLRIFLSFSQVTVPSPFPS